MRFIFLTCDAFLKYILKSERKGNIFMINRQIFIVFFGLLFFSIFFVTACKRTSRTVKPAFYYWKTSGKISAFEQDWLQKNGNLAQKQAETAKIYPKILDVDWDEIRRFPTPVAALQSVATLKQYALVPTVFITNKVFLNLADNQIDTFAHILFQKVQNIMQTEGSPIPFNEFQIDCDWTAKTRDKYFVFLKKINSYLNQNQVLSVTLRLHQVRDRSSAGVPPVQRTMLMLYNMGNLDDPNTQNSIFDAAILRGYLKEAAPYPIPTDIALPLFAWAVVLRDGAPVQLLSNLTLADCENMPFLEKKTDNTFVFTKNTYFHNVYFYADDELRVETPPLSILTEVSDFMAQKSLSPHFTLAFFHLDSATMRRFSPENIEDLRKRFY